MLAWFGIIKYIVVILAQLIVVNFECLSKIVVLVAIKYFHKLNLLQPSYVQLRGRNDVTNRIQLPDA